MSFRQLLLVTCDATFVTCLSNVIKSFCGKPPKKVSNTKDNWRRRANPKVSKPFYNSNIWGFGTPKKFENFSGYIFMLLLKTLSNDAPKE